MSLKRGKFLLGRLSRYLIVLIISLSMSSAAEATTLILTSGEKVTGSVIEKNDYYIMLDLLGSPRTYYLGEISSIDGQEVEIQGPREIMPSPVEEKQIPAPYDKDEQDSLIRCMDSKHQKPPLARPQDLPLVPQRSKEDMDKPVVVATADGGIVVITSRKITKYDKDLKFIKAVDLKADNSKGSD